MKVSIFGLGYVGAVGAACLARDGLPVVGVDVNPEKVAMVASGRAPVVEPGLAELLEEGVRSGRLRATTSAVEAVMATDISFVTVGTPSRLDGALDASTVTRVCDEIGAAIAAKGEPHVVVIRSTVLPGTTARCAEILRKHTEADSFSVAFNPEFTREGAAVRDYDTPPYTIIGTTDSRAEQVLRRVYAPVPAPVIVTEPAVAEMIKLASNAWHATKVVFANEIGRLGLSLGVDAWKVMDILTKDRKLNVSAAYMRPGFAFGGSCLPKDVRALVHLARVRNADVPLLCCLLSSNQAQIDSALHRVLATRRRRIGMVGLAFKAATDDLRESPAVELAERLIGKGYDLRILDPAVGQAKLVGANRDYIESKIPHLSRLLVATASELLDHAEVIVLTQPSAALRDLIRRSNPAVPIIDLAGNSFQVANPDEESVSRE